jgi:hypothetical protein
MEESSMVLGGSTSTLPSRDHAVFLDSKFLFVVPASSSIALTIASVELCGIESRTTLQNFVAFRWRNLRRSPIYRSPVESGRESGRVWGEESSGQLGHLLEDPTVHRLWNSHIDHPSKLQLDLTVQNPGRVRGVHQFSDLFSARKRIRPEFIFFHERDIGHPF